MRALVLQGGFGFEHLNLEERERPECGPGQVVVRIRAVSLNARDVMMARGEYNPRQALPLVVGSDAEGEVVECGAAVTAWQVGDRVCPVFASAWQDGPLTRGARASGLGGPLDGTLREYAVFDENGLVSAPDHLDPAEAACLPCAWVTAHRALVELGGLEAGQTVVCQGSGGVSLAALAIARALGARAIVTSRGPSKLARLAELGASHTIDTVAVPAWSTRVRELTHGEGAHQVLDVGGGQTLTESVRALRLGGTVSVIGVLSGPSAPLDLRPLLMQDLRVQGVFVGSRRTFLDLLALVRAHRLRPVIDRVFPLADARAAFEHADSGTQLGKVVIELG
jgi:NADPH:quinone reductase-like Zn-dependent oxidoreductase